MNVDFVTMFPEVNKDFFAEARNNKSKSLIIKHMQQYLEMDKGHLNSKEKVLHALLAIIANDKVENTIDFPLKKTELIFVLDKLCLLSSLFFNLKVITANGLMSMQEEITHELCALRAGIEFLLLGMDAHREANTALKEYLNNLDTIQAKTEIDLDSLLTLEKELRKLIDTNATDLFQGIQSLNQQGINVRYLLSDVMFESLINA